MIEYYIINSSVGKTLGLAGRYMVTKGDLTYLEGKGWVDLVTREQVTTHYTINFWFPDNITEDVFEALFNLYENSLTPSLRITAKEPSYEQQLMDNVAKDIYKGLIINIDDVFTEPKDLASTAYYQAELFIQERKNNLL